MKQKIIIGLVGEKGGGKETFTTLLQELLPHHKIAKLRSSDVLNETLLIWNLPSTRSNLQNLAIIMDEQYGKGTLTHAVSCRIKKTAADIIIFDGIRWLTDVGMIRSFPKNLLIYITADIKLRYQRSKTRGQKVGEKQTTFEQFQEEEKVYTEQFIPQIAQSADFTIDNNGSLENFKTQLEKFIHQYI